MQSRAESKKSGHPNVAYFGVAAMLRLWWCLRTKAKIINVRLGELASNGLLHCCSKPFMHSCPFLAKCNLPPHPTIKNSSLFYLFLCVWWKPSIKGFTVEGRTDLSFASLIISPLMPKTSMKLLKSAHCLTNPILVNKLNFLENYIN